MNQTPKRSKPASPNTSNRPSAASANKPGKNVKKSKKSFNLSEMPNVRNFLIAFAAGLVAFGVFAAMMPRLLHHSDNPNVTPSENTDNVDDTTPKDPDTPVLSGSTFTAVVGGYDADSGELDALLFLKADKERRRFVIAAIPTSSSFVVTSTDPNTDVTVKTNVRIKDIPLISRDSEKTTRIVDTVRAITGMNVNYYAFFDTSAAISLFEKTGGLYYTVPQDMVYIGTGTEEEPEINLKVGGQVLNAKQMLGLLRFSEYTTDERRNNARRASLQADFVSQGLKQILKADPEKIVDGVTKVLASCETNFTVADFVEYYDLISKFNDYSEANSIITVDLTDSLEYSSTQKLFESYK